MRYAFPPYDFILVGSLSFLIGYILKKTLLKNKTLKRKFALLPYAIPFIFVSIAFAFIVDELPLKLYPYDDYVYDPKVYSGPNPQSISGEGLKIMILYILSVFINLVLWAYCLFLIARYFFSLRRRAM